MPNMPAFIKPYVDGKGVFGTDLDRNRALEEPPGVELIPCRRKPLRRTRTLRDPGANAGMKRTSVVGHNLYFARLADVG